MNRARDLLMRRDSNLPRIDLRATADALALDFLYYAREIRAKLRAWREERRRAEFWRQVDRLDVAHKRCTVDLDCLLDRGHDGLCDLQEHD